MKFEWKVEEQKLRDTKVAVEQFDRRYEYPIEKDFTMDEKLTAISEFSNGAFDYFMELNQQYRMACKNNEIKKDSWGSPKENSAKAWIRKHDYKNIFWDGKDKNNYRTSNVFRCDFVNYYNRVYFGTEITAHKIDMLFYDLLLYLENKENKWFREHDEYEILKHAIRTNRDYLDNNITCVMSSDNKSWLYINDESCDNRRELTIDELRFLLEGQKELEKAREEICKKYKISF